MKNRFFKPVAAHCFMGMLAALICSISTASEPNNSGWVKSAKNPLLSLSSKSFDSENIFAPAVIKYKGRYYLYYAGGPSGPRTNEELVNYQLGMATSDDGETFTKTGTPLLPLGKRDNFHATPALLRNEEGDLLLDDDGTWHIVYCGNRADDIEHATSCDGIHWKKDPRNPIYRGAYAPSLLKTNGEYWMYYIHKPKNRPWEIHLATGPDLYSLKPHPKNPVVAKSQEWEYGHLVYPYVFRDRGTWTMYYAGYWKSMQHTAIGTATSGDGIDWDKSPKNPVLTPTEDSLYDSVYTSSQSVIRDGEIYRMYYAGRVDNIHKYFSISLATKTVGK